MRDKSAAERSFESIEAELNQERAAVLGRYGRRVEQAIARCEARRAGLDVNDQGSVDAYRAEREEALRAIAALCLQREMVGLIDHSWVERVYEVPPAVGR